MKRRCLCGFLTLVLLITMLPALPLRIHAFESMTVSQDMIDVLKKMEGFYKRATWDYKQYTVGYGTRCPDDMLDEYDKETGRDITEEEAEALLWKEMVTYETEVNNFMKKYDLTLQQHQFDALVSFTYNCGGAWTRDTNGYFNNAVRAGDMGNALIYGMCLFSKAGGDYILIKRRLSEANMYLNGEYKAYNKDANPYPSTYKYVYLVGNGGKVSYAIHGYDAALNGSITTSFSQIPVGVDENGNAFVYEFAGWYTASTGGTKVETLDGSLSNGALLYAQWMDPTGQIVQLPQGDPVDNLELTLSSTINVRTGPGTFYSSVDKLKKGSVVTITEVYVDGSTNWGKLESGNWISLSYTDYEEVLANSKLEQEWPKSGTVSGTGVNVRNGPGTGYDVQYQLNKGDPVVISESHDDGSLVWGKLEDGNWICLTYVTFDSEEEEEPAVTGVTLLKAPTRTEYVQKQDLLDPMGGVLQVSYSDGSIQALSLTRAMITSYSNATLGETTVKASYEGYSFSFKVTIIKATVTFLNYDGTVLSQTQYAYGDTVTQPEIPVKPADEAGEYVFVGWDKEVTTCAGDATYTAVFELCVEKFTVTFLNYDGTVLSTAEYELGETVVQPETPVKPADEAGEYIFVGWDKEVTACDGDATYTAVFELKAHKYTVTFLNYDGTVLSTAEYELGETVIEPENPVKPADEAGEYIFIGWDQEVTACDGDATYTAVFELIPAEPDYIPGDFDGSGSVDEDDAIYLLRHIFFPEDYAVETPADFDGNGSVDEDDAIYLLRHVFFPEDYPLTASSN